MLLLTTDSDVRSSQVEPPTVDIVAGYPRSAGESVSLSASGSWARVTLAMVVLGASTMG
jgi:hypothetical protein